MGQNFHKIYHNQETLTNKKYNRYVFPIVDNRDSNKNLKNEEITK